LDFDQLNMFEGIVMICYDNAKNVALV